MKEYDDITTAELKSIALRKAIAASSMLEIADMFNDAKIAYENNKSHNLERKGELIEDSVKLSLNNSTISMPLDDYKKTWQIDINTTIAEASREELVEFIQNSDRILEIGAQVASFFQNVNDFENNLEYIPSPSIVEEVIEQEENIAIGLQKQKPTIGKTF